MSQPNDLPPFNLFASLNYTASPVAEWIPGQPVDSTSEGKAWLDGEKEGWKLVDTSVENTRSVYSLMISGIVPRPIAFVSSLSEDGTANLAPFSWFNMLSANPPLVSVSCMHATNRVKDTALNIQSSKQFTVSIISEAFVQNANYCSIDAPSNVSEWSLSGLTPAPSHHVKPARVKESAFSMECELYQSLDLKHPESGLTTTTIILGHVKYIHVRKDVLNENGTVDPALLKPVSRLGDTSYARLGDGFRLPRPLWNESANA
ncbi:hypothetical protein OF83DRAFT_815123 [Amylostereum chailletii]|nr:hypothetical protein OF83DRAFT_815123 [Amylostereum chailletii]